MPLAATCHLGMGWMTSCGGQQSSIPSGRSTPTQLHGDSYCPSQINQAHCLTPFRIVLRFQSLANDGGYYGDE